MQKKTPVSFGYILCDFSISGWLANHQISIRSFGSAQKLEIEMARNWAQRFIG